MKYVQFHLGDWVSATVDLTPTEKGVYFDLLCRYYQTEEPFIRSYFERITRGYTDVERKAFEFVISLFFVEDENGCFHNERADKEIAACREKSEKARKSIQSRWNKQKKSDTNVLRTKNECNTNHKPITNNHNIYINDSSNHSSASEKNDPDFALDSKDKNPKIPFDEIVGLYNRMCVPGCVECLRLTPARKTALRSRAVELMRFWHAETHDEIIECFRRIFERVSESDFLMGRTQRSGDHSNFRVDLSWILKAENLTKILEEKYS